MSDVQRQMLFPPLPPERQGVKDGATQVNFREPKW